MLIGLALVAVVASVPLLGGSLSRLAALRFRAAWLVVAAIAVQVLIVTVLPGGSPGLHRAAHLASYALLAAFLVANRRLPGVALLALGGGANLLAIAANGGTMPASAAALARAGLDPAPGGFANSAAVEGARLPWLGDVLATPAGLPFSNVFSVGDVLLLAGALVLVHAAGRSRPALAAARLRAGAARRSPA